MDSGIYQKIKNEYEIKRRRAYDALEERKAALYRSVPRLEKIDEEIHKAGLRYNKLILTGLLPSDTAEKRLAESIAALKNEKEKLLVENGFPSGYLNPVFECEKCSDTGIISSSSGEADEFCVCYRQRLINYIYSQSSLTIPDNTGFDSFNANYYPNTVNEERYGIKKSPREQILGILEICTQFVEQYGNPEVKNMLFYGPAGVGKTFLAGCIAVELMKRGYTVIYQTAPALFNTIYEYRYKFSNEETYDQSVYKNILEAGLLIIDDLGTESPSAMRYAELLNIIDTRYAADRKKPCKTIIATNIHPKKLFEYYDERVVSRITGGYDILRFAGDDIRMLKKIKSS